MKVFNFPSLIFSILLLTLVGCATSYKPHCAGYSCFSEGGFVDVRLDTNKYRVRFVGNNFTDMYSVEAGAHRRAGELCRERGYRSYVTLTEGLSARGNNLLGECRIRSTSIQSTSRGGERSNKTVIVDCDRIENLNIVLSYIVTLTISCLNE